jgi:Kef-type K+ transport system membrane component KefB
MPTAEAVIVPILDELELIRPRVGQLIVGRGVIDDVIDVFFDCPRVGLDRAEAMLVTVSQGTGLQERGRVWPSREGPLES